jgi:hypothetical protein
MTIGTITITVGIVFLILLKILFKDKGFHGIDHDEFFKEDLDFVPTWSVLSTSPSMADVSIVSSASTRFWASNRSVSLNV